MTEEGIFICIKDVHSPNAVFPIEVTEKGIIIFFIKLHEFINEVEKSGKWVASDYNWPTNNCQHFTAKLINLLQATRNVHNNDDWIELPKPVLQSLKSNEQE